MNILYLSCHEVLEFDELRMFLTIPGVKVMPMGAYFESGKPTTTRPGIKLDYKPEWVKAFHRILENRKGIDHREHLSEELLDCFDTIIVMHNFDWIIKNQEVLKGRNVIWRDIGQINEKNDEHLHRIKELGVKLIRYSKVNNYDCKIKEDALIPFCKFREDFPKWTGGLKELMTTVQSIKFRDKNCNYLRWHHMQRSIPVRLYGTGNEGTENSRGIPSYAEMLTHMRNHNACWYGGTYPAPYTLSLMEAMFTGLPVVSYKDLGWPSEINDLLLPEQLAENDDDMIDKASAFLDSSPKKMRDISECQRAMAYRNWDSVRVTEKWRQFLNI